MRILLSIARSATCCESLSKHIKNSLEVNNHDVDIIVCSEEDFSEEEERIFKLAIENANNYDLVIEVLLNIANTKEEQGVKIFYKSDIEKRYAAKVQKRLREVFKDKGIVKRDNLYMLNETKAPAIILEVFVCANSEICSGWKEYRTKIAKLITKGNG